MDEVGKTFDPHSDKFTLETVLDLGLEHHSETIGALSAAAGKELAIEEAITKIEKQWEELALDLEGGEIGVDDLPSDDRRNALRLQVLDGLSQPNELLILQTLLSPQLCSLLSRRLECVRHIGFLCCHFLQVSLQLCVPDLRLLQLSPCRLLRSGALFELRRDLPLHLILRLT